MNVDIVQIEFGKGWRTVGVVVSTAELTMMLPKGCPQFSMENIAIVAAAAAATAATNAIPGR
jgi:hypothetical protein